MKTKMNNTTPAAVDGQPVPNAGYVKRQGLLAASLAFTLAGRPHLDLFHQNLDIPPKCPMTIRFTPSPVAFAFYGADALATSKVVVMDAKLFVRSKRVCPELIMAHWHTRLC
jgi:hypothetical protein